MLPDSSPEPVGGSADLRAEEAVTAIHYGFGGLSRRENALARGALLAAANEKSPVTTTEHVGFDEDTARRVLGLLEARR